MSISSPMKHTLVWTACIFLAVTAHAEDGASIPLPDPQLNGGKPLMQALQARRSTKEYTTRPVSQQHLSNLLWAAWGINRPGEDKRTAPSAKNQQEMDVYVATKDGVSRYDAKRHALTKVSSEDVRARTGSQAYIRDAPITLLYVSDFSKMGKDPDERKRFYSGANTGFISQNVYLYCASEGLGTVVRVPGNSDALKEKMGLREDQHVILAQCIGQFSPSLDSKD